jgi:hypothetical protein
MNPGPYFQIASNAMRKVELLQKMFDLEKNKYEIYELEHMQQLIYVGMCFELEYFMMKVAHKIDNDYQKVKEEISSDWKTKGKTQWVQFHWNTVHVFPGSLKVDDEWEKDPQYGFERVWKDIIIKCPEILQYTDFDRLNRNFQFVRKARNDIVHSGKSFVSADPDNVTSLPGLCEFIKLIITRFEPILIQKKI